MMNRSSTGVLNESAHLWMYYVDQIFLVAGYLIFPLLWKRIAEDSKRNVLFIVTGASMFLLIFIILMYPSRFAFIVLAPIVNVILGIIGGAANFFVSAALFDTANIGKILALSAAFAYLLQFFVQIVADNKLLLLMLIVAGTVFMVVITKRAWEWILVECLPPEDEVGSKAPKDITLKKRTLVTFVMSVMAIILLTYYDSRLIRLMLESGMTTITAYSWPRLFAVLGYVFIGILADYKNRRYVNIGFFCLVLWLLLSPIMFAENPTGNGAMVLFYTVVGATMCYMYTLFFAIAPYTGKRAPLYASMCRIIEGIVGVAFSFLPWDTMGLGMIITLGIILASIMLFALAYGGDLYFGAKELQAEPNTTDTPHTEEPKEKLSEDDSFALFAGKFKLTDRESDVCKKLIFTEDSGQEIADDLEISRRVFQRHVASIYEKTGTKSRVGLFKAYHDSSNF